MITTLIVLGCILGYFLGGLGTVFLMSLSKITAPHPRNQEAYGFAFAGWPITLLWIASRYLIEYGNALREGRS